VLGFIEIILIWHQKPSATLTHDETRLFHPHLMLGVYPAYTAIFLESLWSVCYASCAALAW